MPRLSLLVPFLLLPLAGCTSARTVSPDSSAATSANLDLIGETVTIQLANGQRERGRFLGLYPDSTAWLDASGTRVQVPTREVAQVTRVSRWRGFCEGALIAGVSTGLAVATMAYADFGTEEWGRYEEVKAPFIATLGIIYGGMAAVPGGLIGASIGSRERYVVEVPVRADSSLVYRRALPERPYSATTSNGLE